jgi:D-glycero-alpha-D-manno-heptose-7-phosphate kinase
MGGTLDIRTFHTPLARYAPCTVNIALDMRTRVRLLPYREGHVKVSSKGFESAAMALENVPFDHPLGLMFAVAYYFGAGGVHIDIVSTSPPRSALGGSSVAAVALIAALSKAFEKMGGTLPLGEKQTALLAHGIEESEAGVPCGVQDQLAAVFGGVHRWNWPENSQSPHFTREKLVSNADLPDFNRHLLVSYCGVPHVSKDINGTWIRQFISGATRAQWIEIIDCADRFAKALGRRDFPGAVAAMNREMAIREKMTPEILDDLGTQLVATARDVGCGARITGAGGGGCLWALGKTDDIQALRPVWQELLSAREEARVLDCSVDPRGVTTETEFNK